jgi:hypothetical protein
MPKGSDASFARKLYDNLAKQPCFAASSKEKVGTDVAAGSICAWWIIR